MIRQLHVGLAVGLIGVLSACAPSEPTIEKSVEATNAAAKQAWQQPRAPQTVDELRDRALHQADS
jgi:hypothetical protein